VVVVDLLLGGRTDDAAVSRLQLAPETDAPSEAAVRIDALGAGGPVLRRYTRHSPYLGATVPAPVLERSIAGGRGGPTGWSLLRRGVVESLQPDELVLRAEDETAVSIPLAWPDA
jgi:hypothetical protein